MAGEPLSLLPAAPFAADETNRVRSSHASVAPWQVSRTKICACSFCVAVKATNLPSALTAGVAAPTVCTAAAALVLAAGQAVAAIVNAGLARLVPPPPFPGP